MDRIRHAPTLEMEDDAPSRPPTRLAGAVLCAKRHVCAFFHSREEEYAVLIPFIKEGFERGEKAVHVLESSLREEHRKRLTEGGIDVVAGEESGRLELLNSADVYLRDGHFDQDRMLASVQELLDRGKREGFKQTRFVARMDWALEGRPNLDDLAAYEAQLNWVLRRYDDPIICTYDLAKFGGDVVVDAMRTHPMIIIDGVLQENPYFVPPNEFLWRTRQRRVLRDA